MDRRNFIIPDESYTGDEIHHGGTWSEEAKRRYAEARKAKRSVYDMFGSVYNKLAKSGAKVVKSAGKTINKTANNIANKTIYKKQISNSAKRVKVAKGNLAKFVRAQSKIPKRIREVTGHQRKAMGRQLQKNIKSAEKKLSASKNHSVGRIAKDAAKEAAKGIGKAVKGADKSITNLVNGHVAKKDRSTVTKKERKQIQKELKGVRSKLDKNAQDAVNKARSENTGIRGVLKNGIGKSARKRAEKAIASADKAASKKRDKEWSKATKRAQENTVNKHKYKNVGDIIGKTVNSAAKKAGRSISKGVNGAVSAARNAKQKFDGEVAKSKSPLKTIKYTKDGYIEKTDRGFGRTSTYTLSVGNPVEKKSKKSSGKRKRVKHSISANNIYIPGKIGSSEEYLNHYEVIGR